MEKRTQSRATRNSSAESTDKSIRAAAVKAIAKYGFKAANLRDIAKDVGIRAPSLYNYISSKEQLLYELIKEPLNSMLTEYRALVREVDDPSEKLRIFLQVHLNFHLHSKDDVFIGNMELRNLSPSHYRTIIGLREEFAQTLYDIIQEGVDRSVFNTAQPRVISLTMLGMLSGVCNWYRSSGAMSPREMIEFYTDLIFSMLGAAPASAGAKPKPARKRPAS
ncbi:MAG: TetR/AcrR family transcriptional regulator [Betaproteobacteria bacterium]|nr:TetR/AcrR family transcriptional regulator [Betaproteobacteria bacterium]